MTPHECANVIRGLKIDLLVKTIGTLYNERCGHRGGHSEIYIVHVMTVLTISLSCVLFHHACKRVPPASEFACWWIVLILCRLD